MKAIILISSIFYILGLKVSQKIDVTKKSDPVDKVISVKETVSPNPTNSITLEEGSSLIDSGDAAQKSGIVGDHFLRSK